MVASASPPTPALLLRCGGRGGRGERGFDVRRERGIQDDGTIQLGLCLSLLLQGQQHVTEVEMRRGVARPQGNDMTIEVYRFLWSRCCAQKGQGVQSGLKGGVGLEGLAIVELGRGGAPSELVNQPEIV